MFIQGGKVRAIVTNPKVIQVFVMAFTIAFGILYVVQVNAASTKGFAMRDLERANADLRLENARLTGEIDRLRSLSSVSERETFLGLVKIEDVRYLKAGNDDVALRP